MQQFQNYIINGAEDEILDSTLNELKMYEMHSDVPLSMFISEMESINIAKGDDDNNSTFIMEAKEIAHGLYHKYIETGTRMEINISYSLRKEIRNILSDRDRLMESENMTLENLLLLFEKPKLDMYVLLSYSHSRFKQETGYERVTEFMKDKDNTGLGDVTFSYA